MTPSYAPGLGELQGKVLGVDVVDAGELFPQMAGEGFRDRMSGKL